MIIEELGPAKLGSGLSHHFSVRVVILEGSHSGLVRWFAKPVYGESRIEGSNPSLSENFSPYDQ